MNSRSSRRSRLAFLGACALVAAALMPASSASAHDALQASHPAAAEAVATLSEVSLDFNETPLEGAPHLIEVRDAAGALVSTDPVTVIEHTVSVPVIPTTDGSYSVKWQVVSSDGHTASGEFAFTYTGPEAASPEAAGPEATEADGTDAGGADPSTDGGASSGDGSGDGSEDNSGGDLGVIAQSGAAAADTTPWLAIGIGGVVLLFAVLGGALVVRARRRANLAGTGPQNPGA